MKLGVSKLQVLVQCFRESVKIMVLGLFKDRLSIDVKYVVFYPTVTVDIPGELILGSLGVPGTEGRVGTSGGTEVREITLLPIVAPNSFIPAYITTK